MIRLLVAVLVGAATLTGCAAPTALSDQPPGVAAVVAAAVPLPVSIEIPAIDAASTLDHTGMTDGSLDVPPVTEPMQASWWDGSPRPGAPGPAVLLGHVDGVVDGEKGQPGIFARLHMLAPDDVVFVRRTDGSTVQFVVTLVERVPKAAFPAERVYGNTTGPELRLITCGGVFDRVAGHYTDNVVVFARAVPGA